MNTVFMLLSTSVSGSVVILALFLGKRFWKYRLGRQWQYYIWLVAVLRLLFPFAPEVNLMGEVYRAAAPAVEEAVSAPRRLLTAPGSILSAAGTPEDGEAESMRGDGEPESAPEDGKAENARAEAEEISPPEENASRPAAALRLYAWLLWPLGAAALLIQRATAYRSFIRYVRAGARPVSDVKLLDGLAVAARQAGVKRPVELAVNPLAASPLLIGFFRPCIVLNREPLSEKDFHYIALHELTHFKRRDMLYKWLVQLTVCLHWFNPLVWLMSREIARACEFSCDEAVLAGAQEGSARDYGNTLLDAMAAAGIYRESIGSVTLSGNRQLLKERLGAIMNYRKKSWAVRLFTAVLTVCLILGAAFVGGCPVSAADTVTAGLLKARGTVKKPVQVKFDSISITGRGPVGLELVRTRKSKVSFQYLNVDSPKKCAVEQKLDGNTMRISVKNHAKNVCNVAFGEEPHNIVRIYIPDAAYKKLDISLDNAVLCMQDFNAGVHVKSRMGGVSLIDTDISRGVYDIDIASGPLEIEADTITGNITASVDSGPISLCFHKMPENLYLDTTGCGPGVIERPKDWPALCRLGNETPRIILSNEGPLTVTVEEREADRKAKNAGWWGRGDGDDDWWDWDDDDWDWDDDDRDWDDDDWDWDDDDWDDDDWDWDWDWSEYAPFGVTESGGKLYYKKKLIRTFLDELPAEGSRYYRLNINPKGKVNIKAVRDKKGKLTGVAYMTQAEVDRLTGQ